MAPSPPQLRVTDAPQSAPLPLADQAPGVSTLEQVERLPQDRLCTSLNAAAPLPREPVRGQQGARPTEPAAPRRLVHLLASPPSPTTAPSPFARLILEDLLLSQPPPSAALAHAAVQFPLLQTSLARLPAAAQRLLRQRLTAFVLGPQGQREAFRPALVYLLERWSPEEFLALDLGLLGQQLILHDQAALNVAAMICLRRLQAALHADPSPDAGTGPTAVASAPPPLPASLWRRAAQRLSERLWCNDRVLFAAGYLGRCDALARVLALIDDGQISPARVRRTIRNAFELFLQPAIRAGHGDLISIWFSWQGRYEDDATLAVTTEACLNEALRWRQPSIYTAIASRTLRFEDYKYDCKAAAATAAAAAEANETKILTGIENWYDWAETRQPHLPEFYLAAAGGAAVAGHAALLKNLLHLFCQVAQGQDRQAAAARLLPLAQLGGCLTTLEQGLPDIDLSTAAGEEDGGSTAQAIVYVCHAARRGDASALEQLPAGVRQATMAGAGDTILMEAAGSLSLPTFTSALAACDQPAQLGPCIALLLRRAILAPEATVAPLEQLCCRLTSLLTQPVRWPPAARQACTQAAAAAGRWPLALALADVDPLDAHADGRRTLQLDAFVTLLLHGHAAAARPWLEAQLVPPSLPDLLVLRPDIWLDERFWYHFKQLDLPGPTTPHWGLTPAIKQGCRQLARAGRAPELAYLVSLLPPQTARRDLLAWATAAI